MRDDVLGEQLIAAPLGLRRTRGQIEDEQGAEAAGGLRKSLDAGDGVRGGAERVWSRAVVGALGDGGVGEAATRRAVTRLVQEGWLRTESVGRWTRLALEPRLVALLTAWTHRLERAVDETPWHGEWQQLLLRVPADGWRDRPLVEGQLAFEGFGSLGQGVWIAADAGGVVAVRELLREQGRSPRTRSGCARAPPNRVNWSAGPGTWVPCGRRTRSS